MQCTSISVKISEPFNVEVTNKLNTRDPIVRVVKSTFAGQAAATSGITNNANKFKLKVKNQQVTARKIIVELLANLSVRSFV